MHRRFRVRDAAMVMIQQLEATSSNRWDELNGFLNELRKQMKDLKDLVDEFTEEKWKKEIGRLRTEIRSLEQKLRNEFQTSIVQSDQKIQSLQQELGAAQTYIVELQPCFPFRA